MKCAILTIHGIGTQQKGFAQNFHTKLEEKLDIDELKFYEFEWQHLIEPQEDFLINALEHLRWKKTRSFMLEYVGDAIAYAKDSSFYKTCHQALDEKLKEIQSWLGDGHLYIVAHSLGSVIIYDYIYNAENFHAKANMVFRATAASTLNNLECLITCGSPIFLYSLQKYEGGDPINIKKWVNVYSPFDVIGYPVKRINKKFEQSLTINDEKIICGNWLSFWNPMSHISYLDSGRFTKIVCDLIKKG